MAASVAGPEIETDVLDCGLANVSPRNWRRRLRERRYDIVGISVLTENRFDAFKAAAEARALLPDAWVLLGGPHVSGCPEETVADVPAIDAVVAGEGELILRDLAAARRDGRPLDSVAGLYCRRAEKTGEEAKVVFTGMPQQIADLDSLPLLDFGKLPVEKTLFSLEVPGRGIWPAAHLVTTRGCRQRCVFCATAKTHGRRLREQSVARVAEQLEKAQQLGARAIWFHDDVFTADAERLAAICELLAGAPQPTPWCCSARVEQLDREKVRMLKRAGCFSVFYGVECAAERVRKLSGKDAPLDRVLEIGALLDEAGIRKNPGYIFGFPTETREEAWQTQRLMEKIGGLPAPSFLRIYPGTAVETMARERGVLSADFRWSLPPRRGEMKTRCLFGQAPLCFDLLNEHDFLELSALWLKNRSVTRNRFCSFPAIHSFREAVFLGRLAWKSLF
jgi:radical SAM superfamily enzyme YgiQ (UPF0313 family)